MEDRVKNNKGKGRVRNSEKRLKAFSFFVKTDMTLADISREIEVDASTLNRWRKDGYPENWDEARDKYKREINNADREIVKLSEAELTKLEQQKLFLKLSDRNWANLAVALQGFSTDLVERYKAGKLKNMPIKEIKDIFSVIEKTSFILDKLFATVMPAPSGYMLISDVNDIFGMFFKSVLKTISETSSISKEDRIHLITLISEYGDKQCRQLNERNDITQLTLEEGRELFARQNKALGLTDKTKKIKTAIDDYEESKLDTSEKKKAKRVKLNEH